MAFDDFAGATFGVNWKSSERKYRVRIERNVKIPMADGVNLSCDIWRPDSTEKFAAILGFHCYHAAAQTGPITPASISTAQWRNPGQERTNASLEAGDPAFFARRGYVHVVCNARGTGNSEGSWDFLGPREVQDVYEDSLSGCRHSHGATATSVCSAFPTSLKFNCWPPPGSHLI